MSTFRERSFSEGTIERYRGDRYANTNPTWDIEDSPWKVEQVLRMMRAHNLAPASIAEVGCGAGAVLAGMRRVFPEAKLYGFDIAPGAAHLWARQADAGIEFTLGDFFEQSRRPYELLLVLDVIEHLANPFDFLSRLGGYAQGYIFHFPLDLSALSVLREKPLFHVRNKVGHLHYYTKGLALALLEECGYEINDWFYTGAAFSAPQRRWLTRLASLPRRLAYAVGKDFGVRLLGGETLMVLAQRRSTP